MQTGTVAADVHIRRYRAGLHHYPDTIFLYIQVLRVFCVLLDKFAARLDLIAHKQGEKLVAQ